MVGQGGPSSCRRPSPCATRATAGKSYTEVACGVARRRRILWSWKGPPVMWENVRRRAAVCLHPLDHLCDLAAPKHALSVLLLGKRRLQWAFLYVIKSELTAFADDIFGRGGQQISKEY